jgi:hypothetical protein
MRRPLLIAVVLIMAASLPLSAQRGSAHGTVGGGRASFGGHAGMAADSGFASHMGAGHPYAGRGSSSGFAARASARRSSFNGSSFNRSRNGRGFNHFRDRRFRTSRFRHNCYGYRCGWGYAYPYLWGGVDPYWWDSDSSYDQDQQYQIDMANQMNAESLAEQRMREQDDREQNDQDVYAHPSARESKRNAETEVTPATLLVFRDHHQQEVQNYAIIGQTLLIFAPQRTQKISLSDLDLQATVKANDERGVEFRLPAAQEGE